MKLEDLPKKQVFNVPDGYFEKLPGRIQQRIGSSESKAEAMFFKFRLQYVMPAMLIVIVTFFWISNNTPIVESTPEDMIAAVDTEDLLQFLYSSDLSTDDLIQDGQFSGQDADEIETEVYESHFDDDLLDEIANELEVENI